MLQLAFNNQRGALQTNKRPYSKELPTVVSFDSSCSVYNTYTNTIPYFHRVFFRIHSRRTYLLNRRWRRVRQKCVSVVRVHKLITRVFSFSPRPKEQVKNNHVQVENIYLPSLEVPITLCR